MTQTQSPTPTSKLRASLFTKEDCLPCAQTKQYIYDNFYQDEADWPLLDHLTLFRQEDHPALVASFELDRYPTLIVHKDGVEQDRVVGGKTIRGNLRYILTEINQHNYASSL